MKRRVFKNLDDMLRIEEDPNLLEEEVLVVAEPRNGSGTVTFAGIWTFIAKEEFYNFKKIFFEETIQIIEISLIHNRSLFLLFFGRSFGSFVFRLFLCRFSRFCFFTFLLRDAFLLLFLL